MVRFLFSLRLPRIFGCRSVYALRAPVRTPLQVYRACCGYRFCCISGFTHCRAFTAVVPYLLPAWFAAAHRLPRGHSPHYHTHLYLHTATGLLRSRFVVRLFAADVVAAVLDVFSFYALFLPLPHCLRAVLRVTGPTPIVVILRFGCLPPIRYYWLHCKVCLRAAPFGSCPHLPRTPVCYRCGSPARAFHMHCWFWIYARFHVVYHFARIWFTHVHVAVTRIRIHHSLPRCARTLYYAHCVFAFACRARRYCCHAAFLVAVLRWRFAVRLLRICPTRTPHWFGFGSLYRSRLRHRFALTTYTCLHTCTEKHVHAQHRCRTHWFCIFACADVLRIVLHFCRLRISAQCFHFPVSAGSDLLRSACTQFVISGSLRTAHRLPTAWFARSLLPFVLFYGFLAAYRRCFWFRTFLGLLLLAACLWFYIWTRVAFLPLLRIYLWFAAFALHVLCHTHGFFFSLFCTRFIGSGSADLSLSFRVVARCTTFRSATFCCAALPHAADLDRFGSGSRLRYALTRRACEHFARSRTHLPRILHVARLLLRFARGFLFYRLRLRSGFLLPFGCGFTGGFHLWLPALPHAVYFTDG